MEPMEFNNRSGARESLGHHRSPQSTPNRTFHFKDDAGMVTFEFALTVPLLLLVCLAGFWVLRVGQLQAQVQDAARVAVRELARGSDTGAAAAAAQQVLPGVGLELTASGPTVSATTSFEATWPAPIWGGLSHRLIAQSTAIPEDSNE